jgi:DNA repair exonuclease SbcCD nuclease subunit
MLRTMTAPPRPLRVLHTADIHLEGDGYGSPAEQAAQRAGSQRALRQVVDRALAEAVDLVLIAGDLFDHNRVSDETVAFARAELDRLRQPVVVLPGNHDALCANSVYDRPAFMAGASHVRVIRQLDGEIIEFPDLDAVVWGRAMREHEPQFRPLAHIPVRDGRRWCLALGHGFFYPERQRPERSSPIFADEIRDTGWDYVALGHHHVRADVSQGGVAAWYAGAPALHGGDAALGSALRIDFSAETGVRVHGRPPGRDACRD